MTGFPNNCVLFQMGQPHMAMSLRSVPIIPGLQSVNANAKAYVNSIKNKELSAYGFPLEVRATNVNKDGVYISYAILENGKQFGQIDYYYCTSGENKGKFSYREVIGAWLGYQQNSGDDNIYVFELYNVPVEKDGNSLSFKYGQNKNDYFRLGNLHFTNVYDMFYHTAQYVREAGFSTYNLMINLSDELTSTFVYQSYINGGKDTLLSFNENLKIAAVLDEYLDEASNGSYNYNLIYDANRAVKDKGDWSFILDLVGCCYTNGKEVFGKTSFASMDEFNACKLVYDEQTTGVDKDTTFSNIIGWPSVYSLDDKVGATVINKTMDYSSYSSDMAEETGVDTTVINHWKNFFTDVELASFKNFVTKMFELCEVAKEGAYASVKLTDYVLEAPQPH